MRAESQLTTRSLRADQKGKVRAAHGIRPTGISTVNGREIVDDGMVFFWQCQAAKAGKVECNAFKILDVRGEGRGPCMRDPEPDDEPDEADVKPEVKEEVGKTPECVPVKEEVSVKAEQVSAEHVSDELKQEPRREPGPPVVKEELVKEEPPTC